MYPGGTLHLGGCKPGVPGSYFQGCPGVRKYLPKALEPRPPISSGGAQLLFHNASLTLNMTKFSRLVWGIVYNTLHAIQHVLVHYAQTHPLL